METYSFLQQAIAKWTLHSELYTKFCDVQTQPVSFFRRSFCIFTSLGVKNRLHLSEATEFQNDVYWC